MLRSGELCCGNNHFVKTVVQVKRSLYLNARVPCYVFRGYSSKQKVKKKFLHIWDWITLTHGKEMPRKNCRRLKNFFRVNKYASYYSGRCLRRVGESVSLTEMHDASRSK